MKVFILLFILAIAYSHPLEQPYQHVIFYSPVELQYDKIRTLPSSSHSGVAGTKNSIQSPNVLTIVRSHNQLPSDDRAAINQQHTGQLLLQNEQGVPNFENHVRSNANAPPPGLLNEIYKWHADLSVPKEQTKQLLRISEQSAQQSQEALIATDLKNQKRLNSTKPPPGLLNAIFDWYAGTSAPQGQRHQVSQQTKQDGNQEGPNIPPPGLLTVIYDWYAGYSVPKEELSKEKPNTHDQEIHKLSYLDKPVRDNEAVDSEAVVGSVNFDLKKTLNPNQRVNVLSEQSQFVRNYPIINPLFQTRVALQNQPNLALVPQFSSRILSSDLPIKNVYSQVQKPNAQKVFFESIIDDQGVIKQPVLGRESDRVTHNVNSFVPLSRVQQDQNSEDTAGVNSQLPVKAQEIPGVKIIGGRIQAPVVPYQQIVPTGVQRTHQAQENIINDVNQQTVPQEQLSVFRGYIPVISDVGIYGQPLIPLVRASHNFELPPADLPVQPDSIQEIPTRISVQNNKNIQNVVNDYGLPNTQGIPVPVVLQEQSVHGIHGIPVLNTQGQQTRVVNAGNKIHNVLASHQPNQGVESVKLFGVAGPIFNQQQKRVVYLQPFRDLGQRVVLAQNAHELHNIQGIPVQDVQQTQNENNVNSVPVTQQLYNVYQPHQEQVKNLNSGGLENKGKEQIQQQNNVYLQSQRDLNRQAFPVQNTQNSQDIQTVAGVQELHTIQNVPVRDTQEIQQQRKVIYLHSYPRQQLDLKQQAVSTETERNNAHLGGAEVEVSRYLPHNKNGDQFDDGVAIDAKIDENSEKQRDPEAIHDITAPGVQGFPTAVGKFGSNIQYVSQRQYKEEHADQAETIQNIKHLNIVGSNTRDNAEQIQQQNKDVYLQPHQERHGLNQQVIPLQAKQDNVKSGEGNIEFSHYLLQEDEKQTNDGIVIDAKHDDSTEEQHDSEGISPADLKDEPSLAQAEPGAIALAGLGGVASTGPRGIALVGTGGLAMASPQGTSIAGPAKESVTEKSHAKVEH